MLYTYFTVIFPGVIQKLVDPVPRKVKGRGGKGRETKIVCIVLKLLHPVKTNRTWCDFMHVILLQCCI